MAESIVTLRVEARNAISSLNKTSAATKTLSNSAKGATASLHTASTAAKGLGASLAASLGPLITLGAAFATVSNAIGTFTARERDVAILTQGLKNLGEGTVALKELQVAADRLGNQTLFNQEEFTRGFNLLTSFRKIGVDSYERVAQAAADIAQVNQVDVNTSFMQLAKALQDPERNLSNLNRSGIAFTKTQTDVIKELMKTNQTAKAHAMILSIVEESYNKLSQAAAEGFAGNVDSLGEAFRDFSETLGKALEPALIAVTKGLTELIKVTNDFINSPIAGTAAIFAGIALAAKGTIAILGAVKLGLMAVGGAAGVAAIALNSIPFVAAATLLGALTTKIISAAKEQRDFNKALKEGDEQMLKSEFNKIFIERQKLMRKIRELEDSSNKKVLQAKKRELKLLNEDFELIKKRLHSILDTNNKLEKQDELTNSIKINMQDISFATGLLSTGTIDFKDALFDINSETENLNENYRQLGEEIKTSVVDNLKGAVEGTKTLGQAAISVLNRLKSKIIEVALESAVSGIGGLFNRGGNKDNIFSGGNTSFPTEGLGIATKLPLLSGISFANGGRPPVGRASLVGEKGPELFTPKVSGIITPNNALGGSVNVSVSVDASGTSVEGDQPNGEQLGRLIGAAVQAELIKEKRPGGLLG